MMVNCIAISLNYVSISALASLGDSSPSLLYWWEFGVMCGGVFPWYIAYFFKGIWEYVLQIFYVVDVFYGLAMGEW